MRSIFILFFVFVAASTYAQQDYFGTVVLTDGVDLIPNVAIPTPGEVIQAKADATTAKRGADAATLALDVLVGKADALQVQTDALNGSAIVWMSNTSFGSQAVEVDTNATVKIIAMNLTSNVVNMLYIDIYTFFEEEPAGLPTVQHSKVLAGNSATDWESLPDLGTILTTYPFDGKILECYRNTIAVPNTEGALYFRVKGEAKQTVVGQFFRIYHGFTVNGIRGKTIYIEGIGQHIDGLLMEPVAGGQSL